MEKLLKEIINGIKKYEKRENRWECIKGVGSKSYIIKRIDLLREELLDIKKSLK